MARSRDCFGSQDAFERCRRHMLSSLVGFGRHTITGLLRTQNRHQQDWTADYRFYSRERFDDQRVFDLVRQIVESHLDQSQPLVAAMDDSLLRKTGRKIHGVRYLRDPLGPPFQVNLVRGQRVLQISAALPDGKGGARMVPIDFEHAVLPAKPSRKATPEELEVYERERARCNINNVGVARLDHLRRQMDQNGHPQRRLITSVDGRFTNRTVFGAVPERTVLVGRIRKDAVLYHLPKPSPIKDANASTGSWPPRPNNCSKMKPSPGRCSRATPAGRNIPSRSRSLGRWLCA